MTGDNCAPVAGRVDVLPRSDRGSGALVAVRPDQYLALTLPLDGNGELDEFFARLMNPA